MSCIPPTGSCAQSGQSKVIILYSAPCGKAHALTMDYLARSVGIIVDVDWAIYGRGVLTRVMLMCLVGGVEHAGSLWLVVEAVF